MVSLEQSLSHRKATLNVSFWIIWTQLHLLKCASPRSLFKEPKTEKLKTLNLHANRIPKAAYYSYYWSTSYTILSCHLSTSHVTSIILSLYRVLCLFDWGKQRYQLEVVLQFFLLINGFKLRLKFHHQRKKMKKLVLQIKMYHDI